MPVFQLLFDIWVCISQLLPIDSIFMLQYVRITQNDNAYRSFNVSLQSCRFLFYMLGDYSIWYPLLQEISGVSPIFPAGLDNSAMSACDLRRKVLTTIRFDGLRKRHSVVTECIGRQICADIRRAQFIPGGKHIITQSKTGSLQLYSSVGDAVPLASSAPLPYAFMRISLSSRHETLATIL